MSDSKTLARAVLVAVILLAAASPVFATFDLSYIAEIFTGSTEHPNAQYIVIVPYFDMQDLFAGIDVTVFGPTGIPQANFATFAADLPNIFTDQQSILIATPAAQQLFGLAPDQVATGTLPASGLVCFKDPISLFVPDCVSYGSYTGNTLVGGSEAGPPASAPPNGLALRRDFGLDGILQFGDDTNDSATDFGFQSPTPKNFAGLTVGTLTVDKVGGGGIQLNWSGSGAAFSTIHKTDDPSTIRLSPPVAAVGGGGTTWPDPNPNQFPGLSCYLVKP